MDGQVTQQAVQTFSPIALSGWATFLVTLLTLVGSWNRFFGRIEKGLQRNESDISKIEEKLDDVVNSIFCEIRKTNEEIHKIPVSHRPCDDLIKLQKEVAERLARIEEHLGINKYSK